MTGYYNQPLPKPKQNKPKKKYYILNRIYKYTSEQLMDFVLSYIDIGYDAIVLNHWKSQENNIILELGDTNNFLNDKFIFKLIPRCQNITIECAILQWRKTISNEQFRQYTLRLKLLEA